MAVQDFGDRLLQLDSRRFFKQVTRSPLTEGLGSYLRVLIHRNDKQFGPGQQLFQFSAGVQTVEYWHPQIEKDEIGSQFLRSFEKASSIGHDPDNLIFRFEQSLECFGNERVIIRN